MTVMMIRYTVFALIVCILFIIVNFFIPYIVICNYIIMETETIYYFYYMSTFVEFYLGIVQHIKCYPGIECKQANANSLSG